MKKRLVLRPFVLPCLYLVLLLLLMLYTARSLYKEEVVEDNNETDINVVDDNPYYVPVIEEVDTFVLNPYSGENIQEQIGFYDYKGDKENQEKSIIQFGSTYLQNTGITYTSDKDFKIISIMDGNVTKVYENELLGNIVEITHDDIVCVYQMVKDVKVKVGDSVIRGEEIAESGTSQIFPSGSNLHLEIIKDGKIENPKAIIGTNTKEL